jgi:hypothetical protein
MGAYNQRGTKPQETAMQNATTVKWNREHTSGTACRDQETSHDLIVDGELVGWIRASYDATPRGLMCHSCTYRVSQYECNLVGKRAGAFSGTEPTFSVSATMTPAKALAAAKAWMVSHI